MHYKVISDCPRCGGAITPYRSYGRSEKITRDLYQCFQCSRIYCWNDGWHRWSQQKEWDDPEEELYDGKKAKTRIVTGNNKKG